MFQTFLIEATKSTLETIGYNIFPEDSVYSTEYDGENYMAVNLTTIRDMKRYFPKVWDFIESDLEPQINDDEFSFIAFVNENNVGSSLYITSSLKVISRAESKPDGSESNSAAVKIIAILKTEERIIDIQERLNGKDLSKKEVKEESVEESVDEFTINDLTEKDNEFLKMLEGGSTIFGWQPGVASREMSKLNLIDYSNIGGHRLTKTGREYLIKHRGLKESTVSVSLPIDHVGSLKLVSNLEKKILHSIRTMYPDLEQEDIDVFVNGNKKQIRVNISSDVDLDSDYIEHELKGLIAKPMKESMKVMQTIATLKFKELTSEEQSDLKNTFNDLGHKATTTKTEAKITIDGTIDDARRIVSTALQSLFSFENQDIEDITYERKKCEMDNAEFKPLKEKAKYPVYDFDSCGNCLNAIANGEYEGMSKGEKKNLLGMEKEYQLMADGKELGFMHTRCETCNALPGDRYRIKGFKRSEMVKESVSIGQIRGVFDVVVRTSSSEEQNALIKVSQKYKGRKYNDDVMMEIPADDREEVKLVIRKLFLAAGFKIAGSRLKEVYITEAYKHEHYKVGDTIKAYDFEPTKGRPDRYVVGKIIEVNPTDVKYASYKVKADKRSTSYEEGKIVYVPMEVAHMDYDNRITLIKGN